MRVGSVKIREEGIEFAFIVDELLDKVIEG